MEREDFFSGYCRQLDASRMVALITVDGKIDEVDCQYGSCPYEQECPVAARIREAVSQ